MSKQALVAKEIVKKREAMNLSPKEISKKLGISQTDYASIESGSSKVNSEIMQRVLRYFDSFTYDKKIKKSNIESPLKFARECSGANTPDVAAVIDDPSITYESLRLYESKKRMIIFSDTVDALANLYDYPTLREELINHRYIILEDRLQYLTLKPGRKVNIDAPKRIMEEHSITGYNLRKKFGYDFETYFYSFTFRAKKRHKHALEVFAHYFSYDYEKLLNEMNLIKVEGARIPKFASFVKKDPTWFPIPLKEEKIKVAKKSVELVPRVTEIKPKTISINVASDTSPEVIVKVLYSDMKRYFQQKDALDSFIEFMLDQKGHQDPPLSALELSEKLAYLSKEQLKAVYEYTEYLMKKERSA